MPWLVMGEFGSGDELLEAVRALRNEGHRELDAYSPYPVEGMREALQLRPSWIRYATFCAGLCAAVLAYLVQVWCNAVLFPINVGGRPLYSPPTTIPITFESMDLLASLTIFGGLLVAWGLPNLHHPVFKAEGFESVSTNGFWVSSEERTDHGRESALRTVRALGAQHVQAVEVDEEEET